MGTTRRIVRETINRLGYEVKRVSSDANPAVRLLKGMRRFEVDVVFDVGANKGQFVSGLRRVGYDGRVVSFEPLQDAHAALMRAAAHDRAWLVYTRCAVGGDSGRVVINVSGNSVSSSVLPMLDAHAEAAPRSAYVGTEDVPLISLDSAVKEYLRPGDRAFLKIDTQGYEWEVLDGARTTMNSVVGVHCELSLVQLYREQRLWTDIVERLTRDGFELWGLAGGFADPRDGRTLQIDATFFRAGRGASDPAAGVSSAVAVGR